MLLHSWIEIHHGLVVMTWLLYVYWIDSCVIFRLVAQIHDELLFEVDISQVNEFAGEGFLLL